MAPDPGAAKRRILLAIQVITVSTQLLELGVLVFAPDVKTFGPPTGDLQDIGRQFRPSYDFIVVGGSPSASVIASRLSELHQWSVLLLESGKDEEDSHSQQELQDSGCVHQTRPHFREGIVGGNIYLRGSKHEYDSWAESGNIGWDYTSVLEYFKKSEDMRLPKYRGSEHHGTGGYLTLEEYKSYSSVTELILSAGQELGYRENSEIDVSDQFSFSKLYGALRNGMLCCASRAFLRPARHRKNLDISYNSRVERVIIDRNSTKVTGMFFRKFGKEYIIRSNKEVIISAGAIKSPHLLLMSGVGPEEHLRETGILPVVSDLPVGYNLQDHIGFVGLSYKLNKPASDVYSSISNLKTAFQNIFYSGDSSALQNFWDIVAFFNSKYSDPSTDFPDLAVYISGSGGDYGLTEVFSKHKDSFSSLGILLRPRSRGVLRLRSKDPTVSPVLYANYLADQNDRRILIETAKIGLDLCNTTVLRAYGAEAEPLQPCERLPFMSEEYLQCAIEHHTVSLGHYAGTCKMGPNTDPEAVVDPQLRVRGVKGLRVADASIMPTILSTDLRATCVMIGEKASDLIKSDWVGTSSSNEEDYCGCCGSTRKVTIVGGWAWAWWFVTDVQRLSLEVMTLNPMCESVETAQGVPLTVTGVAQCKIMKADELLQTASEQFLGKSVKGIKSTVLQTLEGHLRAILGTLTVEEVYKDRDQFAALVREVAAPDVGRMGIEILSFTIKDVYDEVQYLASLGKAQTAAVKRDADVGVAQANRDAGIREAECEKAAMDVKYTTDTKIEDNSRMFKLQKANFDKEVNTAKAEAQLAYELQAAKIRQRIRNEEIQIEVVERRKQIEIEEQEVQRKERELNATVRLPAEAESYKVQTIAEGKRTQTVDVAKADAERIKKLGAAEAYAIEGVGKAEAERMRMKAAVYKQYGDAAIMSLVLEALPKIAAEVAAPLAKTEEIVLLGGNDALTSEVSRLVGQVPPAVQALTGVDLSKVLSKVPGAK